MTSSTLSLAHSSHSRLVFWRQDTLRQACLALLLLIGGFSFLGFRITQAPWETLALFSVVALGGLGVVARLASRLRDKNVRLLGDVFLLKLAVLLFVLYAGWVPMLDKNSEFFGYDPQRYYFDARTLIEGHFDPQVFRQIALNYTGIVYYYAAIFYVLGQNPVIPALVNAFVTLLATALLVRVGYQIKRTRAPGDWQLGLAMIIPEVVWFDALTARETLTMSLAVFAILSPAEVVLCGSREGSPLRSGLIAMVALALLALVRPPALIPVVAALLLVTLVRRLTRTRLAVGFCVLLSAIGLVAMAPALTDRLGGFGERPAELLARVTAQNPNVLAEMTWSERSIGKLLLPTSPIEAVLFVPPRLLLYILAPLPSIGFGVKGLVEGNWTDWQYLAMTASALIYVLLVPLAFASLAQAWRRKDRAALVFQIPCWLLLFAVAGGNQIIQERYRVLAVPFLFGCIWLGRDCPRKTKTLAYTVWAGILASAAGAYVAYKYLL